MTAAPSEGHPDGTASHRPGRPASGEPVNFAEVALLRVKEARSSPSFYWTDMISLLTQIGVIAAPAGARG